MQWYAASIIFYVRFLDGNQDKYPVWENVYLVCGESSGEAMNMADSIAHEFVKDPDESFTWEGRAAKWELGGIRKLNTVRHTCGDKAHPSAGDEITYSEFHVESKEQLEMLVNGDDVSIIYVA